MLNLLLEEDIKLSRLAFHDESESIESKLSASFEGESKKESLDRSVSFKGLDSGQE